MIKINSSMQIYRQGSNNAGSLGGFFTFGGQPFSVGGESGSVIFSESHDDVGITAVYNLQIWKL